MIAIYSNNYITDYYIRQLKISQSYQIYHSRDQYIFAEAKSKWAFINHLNSYEPPESEQQRLEQVIGGNKFSQEINQLKSHSDLVFAFDNEIHPYLVDIIQQHQQINVYWVLPGSIDFADNYIICNSHFDMMVQHYHLLEHKLKQIQHHSVKPFLFDALLGQSKPHRDFVHKIITDFCLQEKILVTYMNYHSDKFKDDFVWESDIEEFDNSVTRPTDEVVYCGQKIALARILPISVYNQTAYSIVAETGYNNQYSFFTEKTAKPILAQRLFIVFSGRKFLHNLRSLGFKTFDGIIDESYDLIYNNHDRWTAAFDQVQKLCEIDQQEIFDKIKPIVDHNYNHLMTTNWNNQMLIQIQEKINNEIKIH